MSRLTKNDCFYGIYPIKFVWHGTNRDPELIYKKHSFNYYEIEDVLYECWKADPDYLTANLTDETTIYESFSKWMYKNRKRVKNHLNFLIECR